MKPKLPYIAIIDYELGNLFNVLRVCEYLGVPAIITHDKKEILNASGLILPGVGAFYDAMKALEKYDLVSVIKESISMGKPFMGICLGMQLLMTESEEFGSHYGLDVLKGTVKKFPSQKNDKIPQVGWNGLYQASDAHFSWNDSCLSHLRPGDRMYFLHSFYVNLEDKMHMLSKTGYANIEYCSSFRYKNIFATQFHPERSGKKGIEILKNWTHIIFQEKENGCAVAG